MIPTSCAIVFKVYGPGEDPQISEPRWTLHGIAGIRDFGRSVSSSVFADKTFAIQAWQQNPAHHWEMIAGGTYLISSGPAPGIQIFFESGQTMPGTKEPLISGMLNAALANAEQFIVLRNWKREEAHEQTR